MTFEVAVLVALCEFVVDICDDLDIDFFYKMSKTGGFFSCVP